ncbi:hypothetical protein L596_010232 [Steinernema carpocapsae]|uniref:Uncharacterized protein n=1 Tax=Steinernema carpocapsae TaxID=34508 RepID=A0A4U5PI70_STECR|nr:hypothetical protein L596_010232 [Steinernema carpocapsae]
MNNLNGGHGFSMNNGQGNGHLNGHGNGHGHSGMARTAEDLFFGPEDEHVLSVDPLNALMLNVSTALKKPGSGRRVMN